jgi:DNA polymerase-3 subunit beta
MRFRSPQKEISYLLGLAAGNTVAQKGATTNLDKIRIEAVGGRLRIEAQNHDGVLRLTAPCEVLEPGAILVPKDIHKFVAAMPLGQIEVSTDATDGVSLEAVGFKRRFKVFGMAAEHWPTTFAAPRDADRQAIPAAALLALLNPTERSVGSDPTKVTNSVLFEWRAGLLRAVATDGARLTVVEQAVDGLHGSFDFKVREGAFKTLRAVFEDALARSLSISVVPGDRAVAFYVSADGTSTEYVVRLTDGDFPPWAQAIPGRWPEAKIEVDRVALIGALGAVEPSTDKAHDVHFVATGSQLTLSASSPGHGKSEDEIAISSWLTPKGKSAILKGIVNVRLLLETLSKMVDTSVVLAASGPKDPILVAPKSVDAAHPSNIPHLAIVMPMTR